MKKKISKLLAALLALSLVLSLAACDGFRIPEDETEISTTEPAVVSKTPQPKTSKEAVEYFNRVINAVKDEKPAVNPKLSKDVRNVETENAKLKAVVPTVKKYMLHTDTKKAAQGEDLTDIFPVKGQSWASRITDADVKYANCLEAEKTYEINVRFKDAVNPEPLNSSLGKAFDLADINEILEEFKKAEAYLKVDSVDLTYKDCYIKCKVDRATDEVLSVSYFITVDVKSVVTGTGSLEGMGTVPFNFTYTSTASYELSREKAE